MMRLNSAGFEVPPLVLLAGAFVSLVIVYFDSVQALWTVWATHNHRHAFLVPFISAWLIWQARERLEMSERTGSWSGLLALAGLVWVWLIGRLALLQFVEHLALLLMFSASALALLGWRNFREVAFATLFLLFAMPLGDWFIPFLIELTADVSAWLLGLSAIPVFRQENIMTLPGGHFEVADVCAGHAQLTAGLMIGALYVYLYYRGTIKRTLAIVALAVVLMLENGVRAYLVMAIASATEMRYMIGFDHIVFGWILFALTMIGMAWLAGRFANAELQDG